MRLISVLLSLWTLSLDNGAAFAQRVAPKTTAKTTGRELPRTAARSDLPHDLDDVGDAMALYELDKAEYHGWIELGLAIRLDIDGEKQKNSGFYKEGVALKARARERFYDVLQLYPESQAALDAKQILLGKNVPRRKSPPLPVLPEGIKASEENVRLKSLPPPPAAAEASGGTIASSPLRPAIVRTAAPLIGVARVSAPVASYSSGRVYVRSYTTKSGHHVAAHYRSAPRRR